MENYWELVCKIDNVKVEGGVPKGDKQVASSK